MIEYLVESHLGGYYISNKDPEIIKSYCEACGDRDNIILYWQEGKKLETLIDFFSKIKESEEDLIDYYKDGLNKEELIYTLMFKYDCDRHMINEKIK